MPDIRNGLLRSVRFRLPRAVAAPVEALPQGKLLQGKRRRPPQQPVRLREATPAEVLRITLLPDRLNTGNTP